MRKRSVVSAAAGVAGLVSMLLVAAPASPASAAPDPCGFYVTGAVTDPNRTGWYNHCGTGDVTVQVTGQPNSMFWLCLGPGVHNLSDLTGHWMVWDAGTLGDAC